MNKDNAASLTALSNFITLTCWCFSGRACADRMPGLRDRSGRFFFGVVGRVGGRSSFCVDHF